MTSQPDRLAGFNVSRESRARITDYIGLLTKWQRHVNLIGPATLDDVWQRHIADAAQLVPLIESDVKRILDLGSGAGIPGLVLAILLMERQPVTVHLVESTGKKSSFLRRAVLLTGAPAVVHDCRIEKLAKAGPAGPLGRIDLVTARALAPLPKLLELASPWLQAGATGLFHKGREIDRELTESAKCWRITCVKHPSFVDPKGCILEVNDIERAS